MNWDAVMVTGQRRMSQAETHITLTPSIWHARCCLDPGFETGEGDAAALRAMDYYECRVG